MRGAIRAETRTTAMPDSVRRPLRLALAAAGLALAASPALAQSAACLEGQGYLKERQSIVASLNALGKKKIDPHKACSALTKLVANGNTTMKWVESNQAWCSIPDHFAQGLKVDHQKSVEMKNKACQVAAKITQMEKQARQAQQQQQSGGGGGLLGGPGLTGEYRVPRGAL